jgi:hypothetical protein
VQLLCVLLTLCLRRLAVTNEWNFRVIDSVVDGIGHIGRPRFNRLRCHGPLLAAVMRTSSLNRRAEYA